MKGFSDLGFIDSLSAEQIITYLFSSDLSSSVKSLICEEVNKYSSDSAKIVDIRNAFIRRGCFDISLLDDTFCPIELKKLVVDEVYGTNLLDVICDDEVSLERKKKLISLSVSIDSAIELLEKDIPFELKSYLIDNRIVTSKAILDCLKDDDISDEIKEKIIIRKVDMSNLFSLTERVSFSIKNLIFRVKRRDIDDYINGLTSDNIITVITSTEVQRNFFEEILRSKYDTLEDAIKKADKNKLFRLIRLCDDKRLTDTIIEEREDTLFEMIREIEPRMLLVWLNLASLPDDLKEYIINYHEEALNKQIETHTIAVPKNYLGINSHLPLVIERKVFEKYKDEFLRRFSEFTDDEVINEIMHGDCGDLLLNLLIDVGVNEKNIFKLLSQYEVPEKVVNKLFERKADLFKEYVKDLELFDILSLSKFNFSDEIKNRILDVSSEEVASKLSNFDRKVLLRYLKNTNVLFSVKKRIIEHFGIYEVDLQNSLETFNLDNVDLLIKYYKDIKNLITMMGIDFQSFLQYGSGSKKYSNWLVDLTNIIKDGKINDFINVKSYFFNNYYDDYKDRENGVSTISNFLELLGNFYRYNELCLNLANNNIRLSQEDKLNIQFLFNVKGIDTVDVPRNFFEVSLYRESLYESVRERINSNLELDELKGIFNELLFCNADVVLSAIGGVGSLKTLKRENSNSGEIQLLIDELILYSNIIEMVNDTNNLDGMTELLDFVFSDIETLTIFQNIFSQFEKKVTYLYEVDSINHLTSLEKVRRIPGVINHELSLEYGGEVFDFSDKNYVLYGHVLSVNEDIDNRVNGRVSGKRNFISVSPISYKGQKYYWDFSECILAFDKVPKGSYVCSSIYNMGTNHKLSNNCCEVEQFSRMQRGILETSAVFDANSETLLFAEGLKPCGLILPGGRKPNSLELKYHEKYNLPFIITQDIGKSINNPKMVFNNNGCEVSSDMESLKLLKDIIGILSPNVSLQKESSFSTGREIALLTDCHSMYEPTLAALEDIRRRGITERYSLGDEVGDGPNPVEVLELMKEYDVVSVAGNSEYYNTLGIESFPYIQGDRISSCKWTRSKLGDLRVKDLEVYPPSIDLVVGNKRVALCHFANDIRWDFRGYNSAFNYRDNYGDENATRQFLHTNSLDAKEKVEDMTSGIFNPANKGYLSAKEKPLFDGKCVSDYDAIIQGHVHFDMTDKLADTRIYTLRAVGMGYEDDYNDTACYYVLKERKDGDFDIEKTLVPFNRNSLLSNIYTSDLPGKSRVLMYVNSGRDRNGF